MNSLHFPAFLWFSFLCLSLATAVWTSRLLCCGKLLSLNGFLQHPSQRLFPGCTMGAGKAVLTQCCIRMNDYLEDSSPVVLHVLTVQTCSSWEIQQQTSKNHTSLQRLTSPALYQTPSSFRMSSFPGSCSSKVFWTCLNKDWAQSACFLVAKHSCSLAFLLHREVRENKK